MFIIITQREHTMSNISNNLKQVPNHPKFSCDTDGNIYKLDRNNNYRLVSTTSNGARYLKIKMDGKTCLAHRVILTTWCGPCPDNYNADHINRVTVDNRLDNLRWVHKNYNSTRSRKHKKHKMIPTETKQLIKSMLEFGFTAPKIERLTGVERYNIYNIKYNKSSVN